MVLPDSTNEHFNLAVQFVNQTNQHLFLSGKAGTGKTTFLKFIQENSPKKLVVLAPTGVAAMNAGGVTIHSFFQFPLGNFIPTQDMLPSNFDNFFNRKSLLKHLRLTKEKRTIIQELDLIIIDEVSMVRADLIDAVDVVMRSVRQQLHLPFGGVQMLYIGDLFQLPPVVRDHEWNVLSNYYQGVFFFYAKAIQQHPLLYLELKKIYRQSDELFINLLNNFRRNEATNSDFELLQTYYKPDFKPADTLEKYIILTSHNAKADTINEGELNALQGKLYSFEASVEGNFAEKAFPAEKTLILKKGTQIMFIRNDKGESRRYYNGKIGVVQEIDDEGISVVFPGEEDELLLEREVWKNINYKYNHEDDKLEEEVLGTFTQYPVRLAWAITIHKSQGLTFDKAIIDAGNSFAPGQVYVALSRLTSLDGLVLNSPILPHCVSTDRQALAFTKKERETSLLKEELKKAERLYVHDLLVQVFNWTRFSEAAEDLVIGLKNTKAPMKKDLLSTLESLQTSVEDIHKNSRTFVAQLRRLLSEAETNSYHTVHQRLEAANTYFSNKLEKDVYAPVLTYFNKVKKKDKIKKDLQNLKNLSSIIKRKKFQMEHVLKLTLNLTEGKESSFLLKQLNGALREASSSKKIPEQSEA